MLGFFKKKEEMIESKPYPLARGLKELKIKDILFAIHSNDLNKIKELCHKTPQLVNYRIPCHLTIFMYAASFGKLSIVKYFLTLASLDINATRFSNINYPGEGDSALHIAIENKYTEVAILLIQAGISPTILKPNSLLQAVHIAASKGNLEVMQALLNKYPELLNSIDYFGQTPLMWAAMQGQDIIIKYLLSFPAMDIYAYSNYYARDDEGKTALTWALSKGHTTCSQMLINHSQNYVGQFVDQATKNFFPRELTHLILEYDDQEDRPQNRTLNKR